MIAGVEIETNDGAKLGIRKRALQTMRREAMYDIAEEWHRRYRPLHFTKAGANKYGYAQRRTKNIFTGQVRTTKRGRPRSPSPDPLVWSGVSRERATFARIHATSKRSYAASNIPALNFRPNGIDMRAEYTRVLPAEVRKLEEYAEERLLAKINRSNVRVKIKVGV